jgi:hypothetical protein
MEMRFRAVRWRADAGFTTKRSSSAPDPPIEALPGPAPATGGCRTLTEGRMRFGLFPCLVLLLTAGCISPTDPLGHRDALEDAQKRYTNFIRWRDAAKAVQFVDADLRAKFLAQAAELETLEISDYEVGEIEYDDEENTAKVEVTYRGYSLAHLIERKIHVTQEWRRIGNNDWRVRPDLDTVVAQLRGDALQ